MAAPGTAISRRSLRTASQDRHALGDERDLLSSANRLPVALFAMPGFPPRSTVYNIFRAFQRQGVWEAIWEELRAVLRERLGREASPSAGVIDSRSLSRRRGMRERWSRRSGLCAGKG